MNGAGSRLPKCKWAACGFALMVLAFVSAASPQTQPSRETSIKRAIAQLIVEARTAAKDERFTADNPEFAKRFDQDIPNDEVLKAIAQPAHKEPFIDAYVRWQLTSFDPSWPVLDDSAVLKLMSVTPRMLENPRAESGSLETFKRADNAARLSDLESRKLRELAGDLTKQTEKISSFNAPANGYREWVRGKIDESGSRAASLLWLIERCHAEISAGWPSRSIKARMTKDFKAAGLDRDITAQQRAVIDEQARKLIGLKRTAVNEVTFLENGTVNVTFSTYAVDEDDVNKWVALLNGQSD